LLHKEKRPGKRRRSAALGNVKGKSKKAQDDKKKRGGSSKKEREHTSIMRELYWGGNGQ